MKKLFFMVEITLDESHTKLLTDPEIIRLRLQLAAAQIMRENVHGRDAHVGVTANSLPCAECHELTGHKTWCNKYVPLPIGTAELFCPRCRKFVNGHLEYCAQCLEAEIINNHKYKGENVHN